MKYCILFLLVIIPYGLSAQGEGGVFTQQRLAALRTGEGSLGNNPSGLNWFEDLRNKTAKLGVERKLSLEDIQGSVYLDEDFKKGIIYYRYTPYGEYLLRYDAFNDEVELKRTAGPEIEALHKNEAISCEIQREVYRYLSYKDKGGEVQKGYLIELFAGKHYTLYIKRAKKFKEGKPAKTSLQNPFPPRFVDDESYYLSSRAANPTLFKPSKKALLKVVDGVDRQALEQFLKANRVDLKNRGDLTRAIVFVDGL